MLAPVGVELKKWGRVGLRQIRKNIPGAIVGGAVGGVVGAVAARERVLVKVLQCGHNHHNHLKFLLTCHHKFLLTYHQ